ncbi:MAG TPA: branched-chain amino acid ABC transporter permease [Actinomycetota bacterium]|jgi:branched-chain amino acid transport system permease protein|nr:branched-chain amino acid ABC transporter permease [Actinomycetota bacterium]
MAKLTGGPGIATGGAATTQARIARFPIRQSIQWILIMAIALGVGLGAWKTLALPSGQRYSLDAWREFIVLGVAQGAIYALIALGYSLVYGILLMINFAHGEVFMFGAYGSFFVARALDANGILNRHPIPTLVLLLVVAMIFSTLVAILLERIAYRPLRNAPRLVPLITAIGASLFLQNTARGFFGNQTQGYPEFDVFTNKSWTILGVPIGRVQVVVILTSLVAMIALQFFVARTKTGRSMRAVSEDREIAALMGVNVDRVIMVTFAVGGVLAGIAGVLFAITFSQVNFFMGFVPGIKAFTAAVLGGIGSIGGAALGGFILGLLESVGPPLFLSGAHVPSPFQLKDVIAFTILVLVLIFRPGGILGSGEQEKV